jgi:hypothetical protein
MARAGQDESGAFLPRAPDVYILSIFPKIYGERFIKPSRIRLGNQPVKGIGAQGNALIVASVGP